MIYHVSYASDNMTRSLERSRITALRYGCEESLDIKFDPEFKAHCADILSQPRGAGYWLWKPYLIQEAIGDCKVGDIVVYTDAGVEFVNYVGHLLNAMEGDIMLFGNHYQHRDWCKREVFDTMECVDGHQVQASAMVFRANDSTYEFASEWLQLCMLPDWINDVCKPDQYPSFQEHRHDQAILTCLQQRYRLKLHWWPAQYNNGAFVYDKGVYTDNYPVIFHHHRKRNNEWT